jgi:starvation-inducible DNA-binding protein
MHKVFNALPDKVRSEMVSLLNDGLALAIDFQLQSKQAHWNVKGPNFIALHKLFDEVHEIATEAVDLIAERTVQLGGEAKGRVQDVNQKTNLPAYPVDIVDGLDHVNALANSLAAFGKFCLDATDKATEAGDPATADLFTEVLRDGDKYLWFLESHLKGE